MADHNRSDSSISPDKPSGADVFQIAGWIVDPSTNRMSSGSDSIRLEPKVMHVLVYLARRAGATVARDELADAVWAGTVVGEDAITNAIIKLRKAFDDSSRAPKVIETIPKRGYRLLAEVERQPIGEHRADRGAAHADIHVPRTGSRAVTPTIAVLPFRNLSNDPEQEYFSDGITEDITTALANTGWYHVTARHAAFSYKGKASDAHQIGEELGVQYILEGSVRRMGNKLRVAARLIETGDVKQIWGNRYDGALDDIFDFQDQITETVVGTIEGLFHRAEAERVGQKRPESMEAYDYLLRGLAYMNKLTPEDTQTALRFFYKAIEKDTGYGRAYAYAFWCYRREVQTKGMVLSEGEQAEAIRLMDAGVKADSDDPIVLWQAATLKAYFERDFDGALALLDRSLAIDPHSPRAWNTSAMIHGFMGHSDKARQHGEHAMRISPRNPTHWVSYTYIADANLQDMRYPEAAEAARKALQLNGYMVPAHLILAASCAHLGRLDEARAATTQALRLNSDLTVGRLADFFPIARYRNLDAYLEGLRKAGLPD